MNPTRLSLARRRRGWTKKKLAEAVGVTPRAITAYERMEYEPDELALDRMVRALRFPRSFFYRDDPPEISRQAVSFRALTRMSARRRNAAEAAGLLAVELSEWIDERANLPAPNVPAFRHLDARAAAAALRSFWSLGERRIGNMVHLLEANGVRVFSLADDHQDVDAFSFWHDNRPFVILNTRKTAERSRYDAAHEVGHLVLHQHDNLRVRNVEHEANVFAAALLLPEAGVIARAALNPPWVKIKKQKRYWGRRGFGLRPVPS